MVQGSQNTPGNELVPAPKQGGALSPLWYVGVALSVAIVSWYPLFGVMLLAGVARTIVDRGGHRALVGVVLAAVVPIVALAAMLGLSQGLVLVPAAFTSLALATLMCRGRASVTAVSSVVVAGTLASLAVDAIILAGQLPAGLPSSRTSTPPFGRLQRSRSPSWGWAPRLRTFRTQTWFARYRRRYS